MLMNGKQSYAQEFQLAMVMPPSQKKGAALAAIVGRVPAAQLDTDFRQYLKKGMPWRQHHAPNPPLPANIRRLSMTDGEVLVLWARLDPWSGKTEQRAHQRLAQARDLGAPSASFWLGRYNQLHENADDAKELYKYALKQDPDNADYLYGLLNLYWSSQSGMSWAEAARSVMVGQTIQALSKSAHSGAQLNAVAAYQLFSDDVPSALATSQKACESSPDCWPCFHNRAAALFASGQRSDALQAEHDALSRMPEDAAVKMVELVSNAIHYYELAERDPQATEGKPSPGLLAP
jgi:tetratricopeptide (TPR) repeat protein